MSEPKWTKGPWAEHGKGGCSCGQIFGPDGNAVICMVFGPGNVGDDGPDCFPNEDGQKANARLIAAAPELYEAAAMLEAAEDAHANCPECDGGEIPELCPKCFPLFDDARLKREAALAKARGETDA